VRGVEENYAECKRQSALFSEALQKCRCIVAPVFPELAKVYKFINDAAMATQNLEYRKFCGDSVLFNFPRTFEEAFSDLRTTEEYRRVYGMDPVRLFVY
jgi:hypothetical protein